MYRPLGRLFTLFTIFCFLVVVLSGVDNAPGQVHISLAGINGMTVSWQTKDHTPTSLVKYGMTSGKYPLEASGSSSTYYETYDHHVKLTGLKPSTTYFYVVGDETGGFSEEFSFQSAPLSSSLRTNWSFFGFGDLGIVNGQATIDYLAAKKDEVHFVWQFGDESYADDAFLHSGCYVKACFESTWNDFMKAAQSFAAYKPYLVAPGNHEADCHSPDCLVEKSKHTHLSNFTAYNNRFLMPSKESGSGALNMHYSFDYGNVHFITIDTETGFPDAPLEHKYVFPCGGFEEQLKWLENDLVKANANRETTPWILVAGHRPIYQGNSVNVALQKAVEDLMYKYGVDVYFSGHVHWYERNYPVYNSTVEKTYENPRAPTYMMIGGAGNDEIKHPKLLRDRRLQTDPSPKDNALRHSLTGEVLKEDKDMGEWTVVRDTDDHIGVSKVTVIDDSKLKIEYFRTITGELFDSVLLTRDHSKPFGLN